jgi:hypothetical protein
MVSTKIDVDFEEFTKVEFVYVNCAKSLSIFVSIEFPEWLHPSLMIRSAVPLRVWSEGKKPDGLFRVSGIGFRVEDEEGELLRSLHALAALTPALSQRERG